MAADGYGTRGEPEFDDGGAPDTAVDPTLVGEYAGIVGNRIVGTSTQRASFSAIWAGFTGGPWNGLEFEETDTTILYKRIGGAWKAWESPWITYTPTLANIAVGTGGSAASSASYMFRNGRVKVKARFVLGSSGASVGSTPTMTLPVTAVAVPHAYVAYDSGGSMLDIAPVTSTRKAVIVADNTSTTIVRLGYLNSTALPDYPTSSAPWTWAAGDVIYVEFEYDPA